MRLASAAALAAIALCLSTRVAADPPAAGKPIVPAADLPKIGTVGDFPAAPSVEVTVAADGGVYVAGEFCDLPRLKERLAAASSAPGVADEKDPWLRHLSVVLRVAAASRWDVVAWVLMTAADRKVMAHRIFFAVRAEEDDSEGAIGAFLPRDRGIIAGPPAPPAKTVTIRVEPAAGAPGRDLEFGAVREAIAGAGKSPVAEIEAPADASLGAVLETADLCLRAGAVAIEWVGPAPKPPDAEPAAAGGPTTLQKHVARAGPAARGRRLAVAGVAVGEPAGARAEPPKTTRVRGGLAGSLETIELAPEPIPMLSPPTPAPALPPPSPEVTRALDTALQWLAAHQSADGGWDSHGFPWWCRLKRVNPTVEGVGRAGYDVGTTGLALLAFLGAGTSNRSDDAQGFGKTVAAGLRYLKNLQETDGCFGPKTGTHWIYGHAIASLAMLEAYAQTESAVYRSAANAGLEFTTQARNLDGAWRYGIRPGESDTSVTFWAGLGVHTGRAIVWDQEAAGNVPGIAVDEEALAGIETWIAAMTETKTGRVGYRTRGSGPARATEDVDTFPADLSESMTAIGAFLRLAAGKDPESEPLARGLRLMDKLLLRPAWTPSGRIDLYYWHPASLAMAARGGDPAKKWRVALEKALLPSQRADGDVCGPKGSWDPIDPWGDDGGRIYMTATACLCLEAPVRAARLARGR